MINIFSILKIFRLSSALYNDIVMACDRAVLIVPGFHNLAEAQRDDFFIITPARKY